MQREYIFFFLKKLLEIANMYFPVAYPLKIELGKKPIFLFFLLDLQA